MNIEIIGTGFQNKGAHLMLIAIVQELSRSCSDAHLAIRSRLEENWDGKGLGLYQKPGNSESYIANLILKFRFGDKKRESYRMILDQDIDTVLDASGFKYSDQFGHRSILDRAKKIVKWKRAGKKIVLLPQAFGPLEAPRVRKAVHMLADHADLIFPRDQDSLDHLTRLVGKRNNIRLFPDFTNLVAGKRPDYFREVNTRACLIPNAQMIVRTPDTIGKSYLPFFAGCARFLSKAGLNPFILLHEIEKDGPLAQEIRDLSGLHLDIIEEKNPLYIKGIIGSCRLVIGSRYHAMINALSQGVPAVATSWSHKYERLYEEYGSHEWLISNLDFDMEALYVLQTLIDPVNHDEVVCKLKKAAQWNIEKTKKMWREVMEVILA
jgi:colanic acid/amylovoran biosynthesis protein